MQNLILKIIEDKAYLSEEKSLSLLQIGLPEWIEKFYRKACWKIKVNKYNASQKKLHAEVEDYDYAEASFPDLQVSFTQTNEIDGITFRKLDTEFIQRTAVQRY